MYFAWRNSIGKSEEKKRKNTRMNYSLVVGEVWPLTDLTINNIDKKRLDPTRHCIYTSQKKIQIHARVTSTFKVIHVIFHNMFGIGSYTTSTK